VSRIETLSSEHLKSTWYYNSYIEVLYDISNVLQEDAPQSVLLDEIDRDKFGRFIDE
jgi:hypothetical protein